MEPDQDLCQPTKEMQTIKDVCFCSTHQGTKHNNEILKIYVWIQPADKQTRQPTFVVFHTLT